MSKNEEIIESLSPIERKILPYLNEDIGKIIEKSGLDEVSVVRALRFLENKGIVKIKTSEETIIDLGTNGIYYKKNHLPERRLLLLLEEKNNISLEEASKLSKLTENEFKVSLGVLKGKAQISLNNGKISLTASREELTKKTLEEHLIEMLPINIEKLNPESKFALENLKKRKDIIMIGKKNIISFSISDFGKSLAGKKIELDLIEEVTPEVIANWNKNKKFRKYDLNAQAPRIYGGKKHFVNQSIEYAKRIWTDLGFKEMKGPVVESSFWNFDALFTAQDHPVREMHDTFFVKGAKAKIPSGSVLEKTKQAHEKGVGTSKGWQYSWDVEKARKVVLRTHTTGVSARTIAGLKKEDLPAKFFSIAKVFRNETVDWKHGFEFYQTEGIVVDPNANFRHLLGYLREFYKKMGFEKIKFVPSFFPYTEPSVEVQFFHPERNEWIELGGAGMFRPELTIPLFGTAVPVLAWGQGFDRIIMDYYKILDLREMYSNNLKILREKPAWIK